MSPTGWIMPMLGPRIFSNMNSRLLSMSVKLATVKIKLTDVNTTCLVEKAGSWNSS